MQTKETHLSYIQHNNNNTINIPKEFNFNINLFLLGFILCLITLTGVFRNFFVIPDIVFRIIKGKESGTPTLSEFYGKFNVRKK